VPGPGLASSKAGAEPVRVLVTRPDPAARRTAQRLSDLGHLPVLLPLFETRVLNVDPGLASEPHSALIFTSANALKALGQSAENSDDPSIGKAFAASGRPVYTVGGATAHAARITGFSDVRPGEGNGRYLAGLIAADVSAGRLSVTSEASLLYLAAEDRRPDLEDALAQADIPVKAVAVYRMEEISYSTDFILSHKMKPPSDAVLLYSPNAAGRFFSLLPPQSLESAGHRLIVGCLSADVAAACPHAPCLDIRIAERPEEGALLETLGGLR
jgi:uroporphyrinogen-III synthase